MNRKIVENPSRKHLESNRQLQPTIHTITAGVVRAAIHEFTTVLIVISRRGGGGAEEAEQEAGEAAAAGEAKPPRPARQADCHTKAI